MALDSATYLVIREVAIRSGVIESRYRIADGRFVLSNKDLSLVRLTSDEYITGLQGIERVSEAEAQRLIAENGFRRGLDNIAYVESNVEDEQEQEKQEETAEDAPQEEASQTEEDEEQEQEQNNEEE